MLRTKKAPIDPTAPEPRVKVEEASTIKGERIRKKRSIATHPTLRLEKKEKERGVVSENHEEFTERRGKPAPTKKMNCYAMGTQNAGEKGIGSGKIPDGVLGN